MEFMQTYENSNSWAFFPQATIPRSPPRLGFFLLCAVFGFLLPRAQFGELCLLSICLSPLICEVDITYIPIFLLPQPRS